jgi:hypothetical protein
VLVISGVVIFDGVFFAKRGGSVFSGFFGGFGGWAGGLDSLQVPLCKALVLMLAWFGASLKFGGSWDGKALRSGVAARSRGARGVKH